MTSFQSKRRQLLLSRRPVCATNANREQEQTRARSAELLRIRYRFRQGNVGRLGDAGVNARRDGPKTVRAPERSERLVGGDARTQYTLLDY
jgi:hypothetical protein